MTVLIGCHFWA